MPRRLTTFAMLLAYTAGQWAVLPHAHASIAGEKQSDHASRPHVHFPLSEHSKHSHEHHHDGHSHHAPSSECPCEHDSSAVYLPSDLGAASVAPQCVTLVIDMPFVGLATVTPVVGPAVLTRDENAWEIGQECSFDCPRYLALRALLI